MEFAKNLLMRKETEQENPPDGCSAAAPHPLVILNVMISATSKLSQPSVSNEKRTEYLEKR